MYGAETRMLLKHYLDQGGQGVSKAELWTPLEAELRARGLDASIGIRMICAEWLRRERRR